VACPDYGAVLRVVRKSSGVVLGSPGPGIGVLEFGAEPGVDLAADERVHVPCHGRQPIDVQQQGRELQLDGERDRERGVLWAGARVLRGLAAAETPARLGSVEAQRRARRPPTVSAMPTTGRRWLGGGRTGLVPRVVQRAALYRGSVHALKL
jgi:hypothetical protein